MILADLLPIRRVGIQRLANLEVDEVHHYIGLSVQQNNVPANQHVFALRGRGRQLPFKVSRARLEPFLKAWRQRTAPHELFFQSRRQAILLGQSWWKVPFVVVIPAAHRLAVAISVKTLVVIITVLLMALAVSISMPLGQSEIGCEHEEPSRTSNHPCFRAHLFSQLQEVLISG